MNTEIVTFVSCAREVIRSLVPVVLSAAGSAEAVTKKRDGSLVTSTDQLVESRVIAALSTALPGIPVLGEEGAIDSSACAEKTAHEFYKSFLAAPFQLIVDPIDGTRNFVDGRDEFCMAAALSRRVPGGIWPVAAVIALPKQGKLVWCDDQGAFREDLSSGNISELKRGANVSEAISVNSRDRAWLSAEGIGMRLPWVSSGSSIFDFIGSAVGELQGSVVGSQRLWDLMAPLAVADYLGMTLRDLKTGEVVTALSESDLSPDLVLRPWGLNRRMVLLPREQSIEALLQRS